MHPIGPGPAIIELKSGGYIEINHATGLMRAEITPAGPKRLKEKTYYTVIFAAFARHHFLMALAPSFAFKPGKIALLYFAGVVVVVVVVVVDVERSVG
jgi:hypothetical protein